MSTRKLAQACLYQFYCQNLKANKILFGREIAGISVYCFVVHKGDHGEGPVLVKTTHPIADWLQSWESAPKGE